MSDNQPPGTNSGKQIPSLNHNSLSDNEFHRIAKTLKLSPRESQIVCGFFHGRTDRMMAKQLDISEDTVHSHVRRLYAKLGTRDRTGTIIKVFEAREAVAGDDKPAP